jgi:hypothetical protein
MLVSILRDIQAMAVRGGLHFWRHSPGKEPLRGTDG